MLNCDFCCCACFMAAPTLGRTLLTQWEDVGLAPKHCDTKICLVGWYFHTSIGLRFPTYSCLCTWNGHLFGKIGHLHFGPSSTKS